MLLYICFLLALSGAITAEPVSYEGYKVIKVIPTTQQQVEDLRNLLLKETTREVDVWIGVGAVKRPVLVSVSSRMFERYVDAFTSMGLEPVVTINNVQKLADEQKPKPRKGLKEDLGFEYQEYHTLDEINDWIDKITATYEIATKVVIGTSYEGRDISIIQIKTGSQDKPGFFMEGGIHAREWISPATVMYITAQFLDLYETDQDIKDIVDKFDWYILPVFNVDGYKFTWESNRMWRKTRSVDAMTGCYGVDPNRNWGTSWCTEGASNISCSDTYCGPNAFSEIEVEAVSQFIANNAIDVFIDFHSFSQMWMTPYGYKYDLPEDYEDILGGAQAAVNALTPMYGTEYQVGSIANVIYIASGSSVDWTYDAANVKYSYAVELRDTGENGFLLPADQIIPSGEETLAAVIALANYVPAE